ncbi:HAMP domain-containing sensor histidine kinase [Paenibacillus sp. YYML68]|uniref:sensor histidine kinase n=1 Tax=Paenibacillus sp. YYML68 TaxID=2909250 RepID=UPI00249072D8|nr:HAMP domain-containing sensor histidine kinase [Paenibacillus sp. YYML68]
MMKHSTARSPLRRLAAALRTTSQAPNSLRFQLLSRSLLVLTALLIVIGVLQYVLMKDFLYRSKAESIHSQIMSISAETWRSFAEDMRDSNRRPMLFFPDASISYIDERGTVIAVPNGLSRQKLPKEAGRFPQKSQTRYQEQRQGGAYSILRTHDGDEQLVVERSIELRGQRAGSIQISVSTEPMREVVLRQTMIYLLLALAALVGGLLTLLPVIRRTLVPLFNLIGTVELIDAGKLNERFPTGQGQRELDRLAVSFNRMLERLETSFKAEQEAKEQMRRFVADASHELRTPLTSIHGFLEVLLRGAMHRPEQLKTSLTSMHSESVRINKLVSDLLLLAKLDRAPRMEWAVVDLAQLLDQMKPQLELLAGERELILQLPPRAQGTFDRDKLKQVVLNLFHNAVQHTDPQQGCIRLSVTADSDVLTLTVTDNGVGIPQEHVPHVFERFYRSDAARTRKSGGSGLGLAITQSIVELHGGHIRADSKDGEGSVFTVRLPVTGGSGAIG